jgi:predicted DNA-binding protein (UPF0251 family)
MTKWYNRDMGSRTKALEAVGLTERHLEAVRLVLSGESEVAVAKAVGVNRNTISAWIRREDFQQALREGRDRIQTELFSLKADVQRKIMKGGQQTVKCPCCGRMTGAECKKCGGDLLVPNWTVQALIANELERTNATVQRVMVQKGKAPRGKFDVIIGTGPGQVTRVAIETRTEQPEALPPAREDGNGAESSED